MAGSSFGTLFRISTFGESHGGAVGVVLDGAPPGLEISEADIQKELDRRKPGQSSVTTPRKEPDMVHILSGVFEGKTTGTPMLMILYNKDAQPSAYNDIKEMFRPGHADYTYLKNTGSGTIAAADGLLVGRLPDEWLPARLPASCWSSAGSGSWHTPVGLPVSPASRWCRKR